MIIVATVIGGLILLLASREYEYWAPRLALRMVIVAAKCTTDRERWEAEWTAELEAIDRQPAGPKGLLFSAHIFVSYAVTLPIRLMEPNFLVIWVTFGLFYRSWIFAFSFAVVTATNAMIDRKAVGKLEDDMSPTARVTRPWKGGLLDYFWVLLQWASIVGLSVALVANRPGMLTFLGVSLYLGYNFGMQFSKPIRSVVQAWTNRRLCLLDPR